MLSWLAQDLRCGTLWRLEEEEQATLRTEPCILLHWWSHSGQSMSKQRSTGVVYDLRWPEVHTCLGMQNVNILAEIYCKLLFQFQWTSSHWRYPSHSLAKESPRCWFYFSFSSEKCIFSKWTLRIRHKMYRTVKWGRLSTTVLKTVVQMSWKPRVSSTSTPQSLRRHSSLIHKGTQERTSIVQKYNAPWQTTFTWG